MTDRAPRPEGMSDARLAEIVAELSFISGADAVVNAGWTFDAITDLANEVARLRADGATLRDELASVTNTLREIRAQQKEDFKRADEALAAHSASFGALQTLSAALFDGEVDDYAALAEKVIARVKHAEGVVDCAKNVVVSRWDGLSVRDADARIEKLVEAIAAFDADVHKPASAPKEPTPR